ncbi:MAG: hypothetical protein J6V80_04020 [Clostridia bacterium]|nr:hypothetical protein [Clostridia bacterium]
MNLLLDVAFFAFITNRSKYLRSNRRFLLAAQLQRLYLPQEDYKAGDGRQTK